MSYKYVAYDEYDNIVKGSIDVQDQSQAEDALAKAGYTPISLKRGRPRPSMDKVFPSLYGIKSDDVINFARQLATLIEAGLTIPAALKLLQGQVEKPVFRKIIMGLNEELEGGSSFSQALQKYPEAFSNVFCHIAEAGEHSGDLAQSLRQAVEHMERGEMAMKKAKKAMMYPAIVMVVALVVVVVLVTMVLPPLLEMFGKMDADIPATTSALMAITDFTGAYPFQIIGVVGAIVFAIMMYLKRPSGIRMKDKLLLKVPLIGTIVLQSNMALFTRTASTLLAAGVPLTRIMDITTQTAGNELIRDALAEVHEGLIQGHGLSKPMATNDIFPSLLVQMITVGEQTGTLDTSLLNTAAFYESEVNNKVDSLTSVLEPIMTVGIALFVGFIALSVITPMYSVLGSLE
ncbi:MAG: type II secretion system F family protein [Chloroflexi bacterium]|jgi:type IV pilus assembly protein PilC|nr:type II secretion system F family protein [Chloroflexota bacterium]